MAARHSPRLLARPRSSSAPPLRLLRTSPAPPPHLPRTSSLRGPHELAPLHVKWAERRGESYNRSTTALPHLTHGNRAIGPFGSRGCKHNGP
jgi:hypothetical protein